MIVEVVSIGYGVVSMICWGCGDFLAKTIVESVGYYRLGIYVQLVSLVPLFILAAVFTPPVPSSIRTIALILASGICGFLSLFSFYKALSVGKTSIVVPVYSTYSIVAMALSFAILRETLSLLQILCIASVLSGIIVVSLRPKSDGQLNAGIFYALLCMFSLGFNSVLVKLISVEIGEIGTLFFTRVLVTLMALMTILFIKNSFLGDVRRKSSLKMIVLVGLLQFGGFFGLIVGIGVGIVSIVTPISSASPVVTVVLAQLLLKEKLVPIQKIAVVSVLLGIVLLSVLSSA